MTCNTASNVLRDNSQSGNKAEAKSERELSMYVIEMHGQLYGPFAHSPDAYAWGEANHDPRDRIGKRFTVREIYAPQDTHARAAPSAAFGVWGSCCNNNATWILGPDGKIERFDSEAAAQVRANEYTAINNLFGTPNAFRVEQLREG